MSWSKPLFLGIFIESERGDFLLGPPEGPDFSEEGVGFWQTFWVILETMFVSSILV